MYSRRNSGPCAKVDGPLVTAMIDGCWVLLSHAEQVHCIMVCPPCFLKLIRVWLKSGRLIGKLM